MKQHTNTTMAVADCDAPTDKPVHVCHSCSKTFQSKTGLNLHVRSKHTLEFRFNCSVCSKGFVSLYNYRGHLAPHDKVLELKCQECPSTFRHRSSLLQHQKAYHQGMEFKCDREGCKNVFVSQRALRDHVRAIHENVLFTCSKCNKTFKWRFGLRFHEKNAHLDV